MKRLLLLLLLLPALAWAQKPSIDGVAGPTTSSQLESIIIDPTGTGSLLFNNEPSVFLKRYTEKIITPAPTITAGVLTIDLSTGTIAVIQNNSDFNTFNITGALSAGAASFTMYFVSDGSAHSQTWGGQIKFSNAAPPAFSTTAGKVDIVWCSTPDQSAYYCSYLRNF